MKKTVWITIYMFAIIYAVLNNQNSIKITSKANIYLAQNDNLCEGAVSYCIGVNNIMCHMTDPIKGYRVNDTICSNRGTHYHKGIDLSATSGDKSIYAVFSGTVVAAADNNVNCAPDGNLSCSKPACPDSRGTFVVIEIADSRFKGYQVNFLHLSSRLVNVGDTVTAGQKIAVIGNTGCSTGEHLHFQINDPNGNSVNVNDYFTKENTYACGNGISSPTKEEVNPNSFLKDSSGKAYKAKVGNCIGALNGRFYQGMELLSSGTPAYVYAIQGGTVTKTNDNICGEGISVLGTNGQTYTYCHLKTGSNSLNNGDTIKQGDLIGIMGKTGNTIRESVFVSVIKDAKYLDISSEFLNTYGGSCENNDRNNCNTITTSSVERHLCEITFDSDGD